MGRGQGAGATVARWPRMSVVEFDDRTLAVDGGTYHMSGEGIGSLCRVDMNCDLALDVARPLVNMGFLEIRVGASSGSNYFLTDLGHELLSRATEDDPDFELESLDESIPILSWAAGR